MAANALSHMLSGRQYNTPGDEMLDVAQRGMSFFSAAKQLGDQYEVERSQQRLMDLAKSRGGRLDSLSFNDIGTIHDMAAMGLLQKQNSENEQHRLEGMQRRFQADMEHYNQNIYPRMSMLQKAYANGDWDGFAHNVEQLNNAIPTPYRLKRNADGTGFDMYFRKNGQGFVNTGRKLSNEEVLKMSNDLAAGTQFVVTGVDGKKVAVNPSYNLFAERSRLNTQMGNVASSLSPSFMVGPDKKMYRAVFQNKWADYNADSDVILFDQNGNKVGVFGASDLGRRGFFVPNMQTSMGTMPGQMMPMQQGGRSRRGGGGGMSAGIGFSGANPYIKGWAPNLVPGKQGGGKGGRGSGSGGGAVSVDPSTWSSLPKGVSGLIDSLSNEVSEDGKIVKNKFVSETAKLMCRQAPIAPAEAVRQTKELIAQYGPEAVYLAAQRGEFARMYKGGNAQAMPSTSVMPNNGIMPNQQTQQPFAQQNNTTGNRILNATTNVGAGIQTQSPQQNIAQQQGRDSLLESFFNIFKSPDEKDVVVDGQNVTKGLIAKFKASQAQGYKGNFAQFVQQLSQNGQLTPLEENAAASLLRRISKQAEDQEQKAYDDMVERTRREYKANLYKNAERQRKLYDELPDPR